MDSLSLTISLLSPITPTSSMRQSIPASYISIAVEGDFDVDLYMDVNGQWVSGNEDSKIKWYLTDINFDDTVGLQSWQVERAEEERFAEFNERAEWGRMHFTGPAVGSCSGTVLLNWLTSLRMSVSNVVRRSVYGSASP